MGDSRRFSGVSLHKKDGNWRARYIRQDGERVWLKDRFATAEQAAHAYDRAVLADGLPAQPLNFATRELAAGSKRPRSELESEPVKTKVGVEKAQNHAQKNGKEKNNNDKDGWQTVVSKKSKKRKRNKDENGVMSAQTTETARQDNANVLGPKADTGPSPFRFNLDHEQIKTEWVRNLSKLTNICYSQPGFNKYYKGITDKLEKDEWLMVGPMGGKHKGQQPKVFGIDCEMVRCAATEDSATSESTLARISIVQCLNMKDSRDPKFKVVMDEYVKPPETMVVTDYLTHISGITKDKLDQARLTRHAACLAIAKLIKPWDVLIGHGLHSDFNVLQLWHGNWIDSALLCGVSMLPNLTLSLKDVAGAVLSDDLGDFHQSGVAHDSVEDAQWSVRVVGRLVKLEEHGKLRLPHLLSDVPARHKCRLTFHLIPQSVTTEGVQSFADAHAQMARAEVSAEVDKEKTFTLSNIRWSIRRDGSKVGSCTAEFSSPQFAKAVFNSFKVASSGCGGYANSGPCIASGFPDRQNMRRKLICLVDHPPPEQPTLCEVICYFSFHLSFRRSVTIKANVFGHVIGKAGSTMTMIQQVSGARLTVSRQPDRSSTKKELKETGVFLIEADVPSKIDDAAALVKRAARKEFKQP